MGEMGKAMMGTGEADGERRSILAAEAAISNPLLEDVSMKGAHGVLINITGDLDTTLYEVDEAVNRIREEVDESANIIFGHTFDETLSGRVRVSVVATGIDVAHAREGEPQGRRFTLVSDQDEKPEIETDEPEDTVEDMPAAPPAASMSTTAIAADERPTFSARHPLTGRSIGNTATKLELESEPEQEEEANPYIPPRPVTVPKAPPLSAPAEAPTRTSSVADQSAAGSAGIANRVRRGSESLVGKVMHSLGIEDEVNTEPTAARPATEAPAKQNTVEPVQQQRFSGFDIPNRGPLPPADDPDMEIPAFLRRQAN